jgi:hypothetical protein
VTADAEDFVIAAAYRALMKRYHPDRDSRPEAQERARQINAAFEVLSDPARRQAYDKLLGKPPPPPRPPPQVRRTTPAESKSGRLVRLAPVAGILVVVAILVGLVGLRMTTEGGSPGGEMTMAQNKSDNGLSTPLDQSLAFRAAPALIRDQRAGGMQLVVNNDADCYQRAAKFNSLIAVSPCVIYDIGAHEMDKGWRAAWPYLSDVSFDARMEAVSQRYFNGSQDRLFAYLGDAPMMVAADEIALSGGPAQSRSSNPPQSPDQVYKLDGASPVQNDMADWRASMPPPRAAASKKASPSEDDMPDANEAIADGANSPSQAAPD